VPARAKLPDFKGRVHLVVGELSNFALTHFALDPAFPLRDVLVADIAAKAKDYDGAQIDFEAVSPGDRENFYAFLSLLKGALGSKTLSVALPARMKESREGLSYERVAAIADRIVVMAYDEHWSSSDPGPVASMDWCGKVAAYAVSSLGPGKLVMGLPFYGRAWADKSLSRAYKYSSLAELMGEKALGEARRKDQIPYLEYEETVKVKVFFDDRASLQARLGMYRSAAVRKVAFWRLGQEDAEVWGSMIASAAREEPPAPAPVAAPAPAPAAPPAATVPLPPYLFP
jgi:spore germination protein YaaH